jgi:hypothetical protein
VRRDIFTNCSPSAGAPDLLLRGCQLSRHSFGKETPTLIYSATSLLALIFLPSVSRFKQLYRRILQKETEELSANRVAETHLVVGQERV